jgi:hypothetical protein
MWGSVSIDRELIGRLIGPKGSSIQSLEASTGARLAIFDDAGSVQVRTHTLNRHCKVPLGGHFTRAPHKWKPCGRKVQRCMCSVCHKCASSRDPCSQVFAPTAEQYQAAEQAVLAVSGGNLVVRALHTLDPRPAFCLCRITA